MLDSIDRFLRIEPGFDLLEQEIVSGRIDDYTSIPPEAFLFHGWDQVSEERLFRMLLPFLRQQIKRAQTEMPAIYAEHLQAINPVNIRSMEDWWSVPVLFKDDVTEYGIKGFRKAANANPLCLRPNGNMAMIPYGSGGSMGKYTPTFISKTDRTRETYGARRSYNYWGINDGDTALYTYNTTHKGGQWIQESLWAHGVDTCIKRSDEAAVNVLQNMADYGVNVLITVQQPYEAMQSQTKAVGVNLHTLVEVSLEHPEKFAGILVPDENGKRQIEFIFLGGFEIVPYAMELSQNYLNNIPMATLLGSSEAIPQACSINPALVPHGNCHHNNLHLLHGPHYVEVVKYRDGKWIPVGKGEEGLLVYTSWSRDGTLWIRYAPGDVATRLLNEGECPCGIHSPIISNVHRKDSTEREALFVNGCAAG